MTQKELNEIGAWLTSQGHEVDLKDCLWMEEYEWQEHKTRDICDLINDYHQDKKARLLEEVAQTVKEELDDNCFKVLTSDGETLTVIDTSDMNEIVINIIKKLELV